MTVYGSHFVARTKVFIEGNDVGRLVSLSATFSRKNISAQCRIQLPFHLIRFKNGTRYYTSGSRITPSAILLQTGSMIEVVAWYESFGKKLPDVTIFKGYVREVVDGYPATLVCEDLCFPLKFGSINKDWKTATQLQTAAKECIRIGNEAFIRYREARGFTDNSAVPLLKLAESESASAEFTLGVYTGVSPHTALSHIMRLWNLYTNVDDSGNFYMGLGFTQASPLAATVKLSGAINVVGRNIVPKESLFENYQVIVNGMTQNGNKISVQVGDSYGERKEFSRISLVTKEGLSSFACSVLNELKAAKNSGTITTLLYPVVNVLDYIEYDDTVFDSFSGSYYVIGKSYTIGDNGIRQELSVTNQKYAI